MLHRFSQHAGLSLGNILLDIDLGEFDGLPLLELQLELFVVLTGFFEELHRFRLLVDALSFGVELQSIDFRFGSTLLLSRIGLRHQHLDFAQANRSRLFGRRFGEHLLGARNLFTRCLFGFGSNHDLFSVQFGGLLLGFRCFNPLIQLLVSDQLRGLLVSLGFLDAFDHIFLCDRFSQRHLDLLLTIRTGEGLGVFDEFLFDDHQFFNRDTLLDHVLNRLLLNFDGLLLVNVLEGCEALPFDRLELLIALHAFHLDHIGPLFVTQGHEHLALLVFGGNFDLLIGSDPCPLGFLTLLFADLHRLCLFPRLNHMHLALLLRLSLGKLAFQFENRFTRLDVLLLDDLLLVALDIVRKLRLLSGQVSDLSDTLGIENIVGIK